MASHLQYVFLYQQVMAQVKAQLGIIDKDIADYLIDQAFESQTESEFSEKIKEDVELPDQFMNNLFKLIKSKESIIKAKKVVKNNNSPQQQDDEKKLKFQNAIDNEKNDMEIERDEQKQEDIVKKVQNKDEEGSDDEEEQRKKEEQQKCKEFAKLIPVLAKKNEIELNIQSDDKEELQNIYFQQNQKSSLNIKDIKGKNHSERDQTHLKSHSRSRSPQKDKNNKKSRSHSNERSKRNTSANKSKDRKIRSLSRDKKNKCNSRSPDDFRNKLKIGSPLRNIFNDKKKISRSTSTGKQNISKPRRQEVVEAKFGSLTGITIIADNEEKSKKKSREDSQDKWKQKSAEYHSRKHIGADIQDLDLDEGHSEDEEGIEIKIRENVTPFLKDTITKAGVNLYPIRVVKNQNGILSLQALNAEQKEKNRREIRYQQNQALIDSINKFQNQKINQDPNTDSAFLLSNLRHLGEQQPEIPEQKKESMFKAALNSTSLGESKQPEIPEQKKESMFKAALNSTGKINSLMAIKEQKESIPIVMYKEQLINACQNNNILIVIDETGSGITTQMTQYLLEAGFSKSGKKIGCTQPRRVAAISAAKRVSEEMGVVLGEEVGYAIRFEDCTSASTVIKYMTDGMLLREILLDKELSDYSCILLDEVHERSLNTDVLFGLLKNVVKKRKDFKLIITSTTLDAAKFSSYFFDCQVFHIPDSYFNVDTLYSAEPEQDYIEASLNVIMQIHLTEPHGDILLFLTSQEEIDNTCKILFERIKCLGPDAPELIILPLYAGLLNQLQNRIFLPTPEGKRKCIVSTNIAEASLTIDGIYYVVDPGLARIKVYNPKIDVDSQILVPISQASAKQRAGRVGRTGPGKCFRLYTEEAFKNEMLKTSVPEIQHTNLASAVLLLKAMGINDLINFDFMFMDPPPIQNLISALEHLYTLGCLDDEGILTRLGLKMVEFPLEPPLSKMLITSIDLGCSDEISTIIGMLSVEKVFLSYDKKQQSDYMPAKFFHSDGDHLTLLTVYEAWKGNNFSNIWCHENFIDSRTIKRAQDIRKQLIGIMEHYKLPVQSCGKNYAKVRKAICAGFFNHAAKKDSTQGYKTIIDNHSVHIHPTSSLFQKSPDWVCYSKLFLTTKEYMRNICTIDPQWLVDVAPNFFQTANPFVLPKAKKAEKI